MSLYRESLSRPFPTALQPMSTAPLARIFAHHYEHGFLVLTPDHEANWWLAYKLPGITHWFIEDQEESPSIDSADLDGWYFQVA